MGSLFRYKASAIGIAAGISIALLSLFYADYIRQLENLEENETETFSYPYQSCFSVMTHSEADYQLVSDTLRQFPVTIITENASLYVDDECAEHLCRVIVSQNEALRYHLSSGHYPADGELEEGKPIVILGRAMKEHAFSKQDEEYILICGEEYKVIGYCSGERTTITNYSVLLFADCLGEQTRMDVWRAGNTFTQTYSLNSDTIPLREIYNEINGELEKAGIQIGPLMEYRSDFNGSRYRGTYIKLAYIIYFFALFLTLAVIQYWLHQRKYEIAVRRIYGYGRGKICRYILKELTGLLVLSVLISLLLYGGIAFAYNRGYGIRMPGIYGSMFRFLALAGVTLIILMIGAIWNIFRKSPLSAYRGGRK